MSRAIQALLALALLIGGGIAIRYSYRQVMDSVLKEADASTKNMGQWKAVKTNFDGVKFDRPIMAVPKVNIGQPSNRSKAKDNHFN